MKKLLYLFIGLYFLLSACDEKSNNQDYNKGKDIPAREHFSEKDLKYQGQSVIITKHGSCRMDCRKLDAYEIQEVISKGKINRRKSNPDSKPCPTVAYDGYTSDRQKARVVLGTCENDIKVVTVIDLNTEWKCACK
jgi:hypothetical protein